jgi:hypothetical protein
MLETAPPAFGNRKRENKSSFWTGERGSVNPTGTVPEVFSASIPAPDATAVEYLLSAADRSGNRETLPRVTPGGFYSFEIAAR